MKVKRLEVFTPDALDLWRSVATFENVDVQYRGGSTRFSTIDPERVPRLQAVAFFDGRPVAKMIILDDHPVDIGPECITIRGCLDHGDLTDRDYMEWELVL